MWLLILYDVYVSINMDKSSLATKWQQPDLDFFTLSKALEKRVSGFDTAVVINYDAVVVFRSQALESFLCRWV